MTNNDIHNLIKKDYNDFKLLEEEIVNPNNESCIETTKNYYILKKKLEKFFEYKKILKEIEETETIINTENVEKQLKELAIHELKILEQKKYSIENEIKNKYNSDNSKKNADKIFLELRAASGGVESSIFVEDMLKMYLNYFNNNKWQHKIISLSKNNIYGYKEVILEVCAYNVELKLKNEAGTHRVQRIPITESHGKIQTSTCTVAILPETDVNENIILNNNELRIDTFRASGAGGQHVNMTDSAVRIIHLPTNITVECQSERSQHKNKNIALKLLKAKLLFKKKNEQKNLLDTKRKNMIGSGDRAEKIRTYNYVQNRVTDHRKNITVYRLKDIMNGNLNILIEE